MTAKLNDHRMTIGYPYKSNERRKWIEDVRPGKNKLDPRRPYAWTKDKERNSNGHIIDSGAIFLTNRECPWRCLMCDLWKNTLKDPVPPGAIPEQIRFGLDKLGKSMRSSSTTAEASSITRRSRQKITRISQS